MIPEHIQKAILKVDKQVLSILKAHELVMKSSRSLLRAELTPKAYQDLEVEMPVVTDEVIDKWRKMWPAALRGTKTVLARKMLRFISEYNVDVQTIFNATELWLEQNQKPYCGNANNFFYLIDKTSKEETSRCEQAIELLKEYGARSHNSKLLT